MDGQNADVKFIAKLIRFRPDLWERIQLFQRREFIKRDQDAIFLLLDQALSAQGIEQQRQDDPTR